MKSIKAENRPNLASLVNNCINIDLDICIVPFNRKAILIGQQPKSPARDERVAFLSSLGTHSFYVKEAWRNYVAHGRTRYDEEAAHEIVTNVRGFMAKIARSVLPL